MLIDDKLREEGINLHECRIGDHKTTCPDCSHMRRNSKDPCLSVTVESEEAAVWKCHHCGWADQIGGGGGGKRDDFTTKERHKTRSVKNESQPPPKAPAKPKPSSDRDALLAFFKERGISEATLDHFGIFAAEHYFPALKATKPAVVIPYLEDGTVVNHKYRAIEKKAFMQDKGTKRTLFNIDGVKAHWLANPDAPKEVVFVEGEMDVLALYEAGVTNATTLPDGASKTIKIGGDDKRFAALRNCPWIEDAERVLLAGDNDEAGLTLRAELVRRFGAPVCWTVEWAEGRKDANETLMNLSGDDPTVLAAYLEDATPMPIDGIHGVNEYRDQVLELYHGKFVKPFSTGFDHLDEIYKVMPGTFNVVTGVPSHGKSNFIDQLAVNLMRNDDWRFAVFSPEHSTTNHIRRLVEKVAERPFDPGPNPRMTEDQLNKAMDFLNNKIHFIEAEERVPDIDWILDCIKGTVLRYGVRGAIIDPYNEISSRRDVGKREDEHVRDLISSCKLLCRNHGLTIWMVAHPTKLQRDPNGKRPVPELYDIAGAAHWYNMADAGLVVYRNFATDQTKVYTRKIREQGVYGQIGEADFRFSTHRRVYIKDSDFEDIDDMPSSAAATGDDDDGSCPF